MTLYLGVTKDQLFRLRDKLHLPLRLDRSKRAKPPRHRDPTPEEIAAACAALRAKHFEQRRNEPPRQYRNPDELVQYKLEHSRQRVDDRLEQLIDDFADP